jgi:hypothetical protein
MAGRGGPRVVSWWLLQLVGPCGAGAPLLGRRQLETRPRGRKTNDRVIMMTDFAQAPAARVVRLQLP